MSGVMRHAAAFASLFCKPFQHILRDAHHRSISALQAMCPVGGRGGENSSSTSVEAQAGRPRAPSFPFFIPFGIVRVPAHWTSREHLKRSRRAVLAGRKRQSLSPGKFAAVTFITDDGVLAAELLATLQAGAGKNPMIGALHLILRRISHKLAMAFAVATPQEADPGHFVLWTLEQVMTPKSADVFELSPLVHRIEVVVLLAAGEGATTLFGTNLPAAGVAAKKGDVAALANPAFEIVAHRAAPVFVMADTQNEFVAG